MSILSTVVEQMMYRGHSAGNVSANPIIMWVSTDMNLAQGYANWRESPVVSTINFTPRSPLNLGNAHGVEKLSYIVNQMIKQTRVDKVAIKDRFLSLRSGLLVVDPVDNIHSHIYKYQKQIVSMALLCGFDCIMLIENGVMTYGIFQ